ncbi:lipocalin family protein [Flavivirga algicola]|uniref:Lipocalin-like domain-containing protein n=1 Tax=Flavivirga algicola TaxID=2729136 RepID=A0ABX1RZD2_9FLAO|nr:lipocalin family protein [Flavivirga algicola]NMH88153.1 hypothetical protein [Flavivirga algicola]
MNTFKLTSLIIFATCLTFSCSKDDSPSKINSELIIGTWKLTNASKDGETVSLTACDLLNTLLFTKTQISYISYYKGTTTVCTSSSSISKYSISGNTVTDSYQSKEIMMLDSTELVLKYTVTNNGETSVMIDTYTKQ